MLKKLHWLAAPLFAAVLTSAVFPNEVKLKNGDKISGKIIERNDEHVIIETDYAGKIMISAEHIASIADRTEEASAGNAGNDAKAIPVTVKEKTEPITPPPPKARLFGGRYIGIAEGWEGNANIGFSYTTGNSRTSTMTTGIRAVKTGGIDKLTVYVRSQWHNDRKRTAFNTTQNAIWGGTRYDRNLNGKIFGFASYDFERDRPKRLNFRSVLGGGVGYRPIRNENTEVDLLLGAAWNRTWQIGPNTDTPEGLAGAVLKHRFHERLKLQSTFTVYQNVTDRREFRFIFDSTFSADITKRIGWHITVGDRFNNDPVGTAEKNDVLITTGLRWNFGKKK
ncbi:YdiY family protein [Leptolyngbya sp. 7M]|uniref:DUF481 domain-containing protein n=1 Tax=Leptolyngbya sp. 7M TaxID=2812896 RepID=UPI001B8BC406|nr:DUF481 domain-containing protein [Leptolyngbya sp. 7M]QYO66214.1 DUF481 domain-containing protein [Leptolyngbya sp. 7M]